MGRREGSRPRDAVGPLGARVTRPPLTPEQVEAAYRLAEADFRYCQCLKDWGDAAMRSPDANKHPKPLIDPFTTALGIARREWERVRPA